MLPTEIDCVPTANNNTGSLTIPSDLKAGNYVLRHEIIALHSAGQEDGAQAYPQCTCPYPHILLSSLTLHYQASTSKSPALGLPALALTAPQPAKLAPRSTLRLTQASWSTSTSL